MSHDIPPCDEAHKPYNAHQGGYAAPIMINVSEGRLSQDLGDLATPRWADMHPSQAAPLTRLSRLPERRATSSITFRRSTGRTSAVSGSSPRWATTEPRLEYGTGW